MSKRYTVVGEPDADEVTVDLTDDDVSIEEDDLDTTDIVDDSVEENEDPDKDEDEDDSEDESKEPVKPEGKTFTEDQVKKMVVKRFSQLKKEAIDKEAKALHATLVTENDEVKLENESLRRENESYKLSREYDVKFDFLIKTKLSGDELKEYAEALSKDLPTGNTKKETRPSVLKESIAGTEKSSGVFSFADLKNK